MITKAHARKLRKAIEKTAVTLTHMPKIQKLVTMRNIGLLTLIITFGSRAYTVGRRYDDEITRQSF